MNGKLFFEIFKGIKFVSSVKIFVILSVRSFYFTVIGLVSTFTPLTNGTLTINNSKSDGFSSAVKAIVTIGDYKHEFTSTSTESWTISNFSLKPGEAQDVKVLFYIDGNDENVKTSNTQDITGTLALEFTASEAISGS